MLKKILKLLKKVCVAFVILYGFNLILSSANILIPINIWTLGSVTFLGLPGFVSLVTMFFIIK